MTDPTPTPAALRELIDSGRVAVGALRETARLRAGENATPLDVVADRLVQACHQAEDLAAALAASERAQTSIREALRHAERFISNGIDLGYIRMPNSDCPDTAHDTLPVIRAALRTADALPQPTNGGQSDGT